MSIDNYVLDSNGENLIARLNNNDASCLQVNDSHDSKQANIDKEYHLQWKESPDPNSYGTSRCSLENSAYSSFQNSLECTEVPGVTKSSLQDGNSLSSQSVDCKPREPRRGRASLVRLQAATATSPSADADFSLSGPVSRDSSVHQSSPSVSGNAWASPAFCPDSSVADMQYASTANEIRESADFSSSSSTLDFDEIPNNQDVQKYLTTDGQYVYGYKNASGEFHFFYPSLNDRERHNEKERRRRSRVSEVCKSLRQIVPGLCEKIDKASVFEHTARYLQFLRDKYGTQFDQEYCEKNFLFGRK